MSCWKLCCPLLKSKTSYKISIFDIDIRKKGSMRRKYLKILVFIIGMLLTVGYSYYFRPIVDDELYNYGFSYNILKGLVPYKDFNMIITPLFNYLLAVILKIFGNKLIVYHFTVAFLITFISYLSYKEIKWGALIIYLLLLIYPYTGYNVFALEILFSLFSLINKKIKK